MTLQLPLFSNEAPALGHQHLMAVRASPPPSSPFGIQGGDGLPVAAVLAIQALLNEQYREPQRLLVSGLSSR